MVEDVVLGRQEQFGLKFTRIRNGRWYWYLPTLTLLWSKTFLAIFLLTLFFEKFFVNSDTSFTLDLLLGSLLMLLPHVHDGSCLRAVTLVTVHALEIFRNLVGGTSMLSGFLCLSGTLTFFAATHIGRVSSNRQIICNWLQLATLGIRVSLADIRPHDCELASLANDLIIFLLGQLSLQLLHLDHFLLNLQLASLWLAICFCMLSELEVAHGIKSTQAKHFSLADQGPCTLQHACTRWTCYLFAWEFAVQWTCFRGVAHLVVGVKKACS